jgi:hypothetical protein
MKTFILIIITHYIADFVFQAEKWSLNKSKHLIPLIKHTLTYSMCWAMPVYLISRDLMSVLLFVSVTFIAHTITDYFTSKVVGKKFEDKYYGSPIPNFGAFSTIGFDQVLHYLQLIITWNWLFGLK